MAACVSYISAPHERYGNNKDSSLSYDFSAHLICLHSSSPLSFVSIPNRATPVLETVPRYGQELKHLIAMTGLGPLAAWVTVLVENATQ